METTIDGAGRVVVPKAIRTALGLSAGTTLRISEQDGCIVMEPVPAPMRLVRRGKGLVATADLPPLTAEEVRAVLESGRR